VGSPRAAQRAHRRAWNPSAYDLSRQPQRPGELCTEIYLDGPSGDRGIECGISASGLPAVLSATLAIECHRVLDSASTLFGVPTVLVERLLDIASTELATRSDESMTPVGSRLTDYARALLDAHRGVATATIGPIVLRVSTTMLAAWQLASEAADEHLEQWAMRRLHAPPQEFVRWEASAALLGQTLAEWALVQTARRLRPASTLAQTAE
jgi:hypothetical protein